MIWSPVWDSQVYCPAQVSQHEYSLHDGLQLGSQVASQVPLQEASQVGQPGQVQFV